MKDLDLDKYNEIHAKVLRPIPTEFHSVLSYLAHEKAEFPSTETPRSDIITCLMEYVAALKLPIEQFEERIRKESKDIKTIYSVYDNGKATKRIRIYIITMPSNFANDTYIEDRNYPLNADDWSALYEYIQSIITKGYWRKDVKDNPLNDDPSIYFTHIISPYMIKEVKINVVEIKE